MWACQLVTSLRICLLWRLCPLEEISHSVSSVLVGRRAHWPTIADATTRRMSSSTEHSRTGTRVNGSTVVRQSWGDLVTRPWVCQTDCMMQRRLYDATCAQMTLIQANMLCSLGLGRCLTLSDPRPSSTP